MMGWGKRGRHCSSENQETESGAGGSEINKTDNSGEEDIKAHFGKRPRDVSPLSDVVPEPNGLIVKKGVEGTAKGEIGSCASMQEEYSKVLPENNDSMVPAEEQVISLSELKIRTFAPKMVLNGAQKSRGGPRVTAARLRTAYPKKMSPSKKRASLSSTPESSSGAATPSSSTSSTNDDEAYITVDYEEIPESESIAVDSEESIEEDTSVGTSESGNVKLPEANAIPEVVPAIRPSYFPFVPPYINFCLHNQKTEALPKEIQKHLKWRWSNITPVVVKKTLTNSGFRILRKTVDWGGQWGRHMKGAMFRTLIKDFQKINHLPGTFQIGRKDRLWRNIQKYMSKFGGEEFGFMPTTFILPEEVKQLKTAWDSADLKMWIVKPPAGARGTGIRVVNRWNQIPKKKPVIVQSYVGNPYLINDRKFDLRLYVLVSNFHPLKVYIYNDGLVRFAPVKYSSDSKRASDRYMHLTNYSINKNCELYTQNGDAEASEGHKWTLKTLWRHFIKEGKDVQKLWTQIEDIVMKTLICAEDPITSSISCHLPNLYNGYELLGFDIILDCDLKPWLLEVNISPSLHSSSPLDLAVKGPMIKEVLNIAGYHLPPKLSPVLKNMFSNSLDVPLNLETPVFDKRIYVNNNLTKAEQTKHKFFKSKFGSRNEYLESIIQNLSPDDVRQLIIAEDELSQCDNFSRIFPGTTSHSYFRYFENPRYYNMLFDAWEVKYQDDRPQAVSRLKELCHQKVHLQVSVPAESMICESQVTETEAITSDPSCSTLSNMTEKMTGTEPHQPLERAQELSDNDNTNNPTDISSNNNPSTQPLNPVNTLAPTSTPAVLDNITNLSTTCPCHTSPGSDRSPIKPPTPSKVSDLPKGVCC